MITVAMQELLDTAKGYAIVQHFYFPHITKKDQAAGRRGNSSERANFFYHCAVCSGFRADIVGFSEAGTTVEVAKVLHHGKNNPLRDFSSYQT